MNCVKFVILFCTRAYVVYHVGVIEQREIRRESDRELRGDTNEWLYRVERENMRTLEYSSHASKNIDQRDNVISLFTYTTLYIRSDEEFGRINVGTIVFTLSR